MYFCNYIIHCHTMLLLVVFNNVHGKLLDAVFYRLVFLPAILGLHHPVINPLNQHDSSAHNATTRCSTMATCTCTQTGCHRIFYRVTTFQTMWNYLTNSMTFPWRFLALLSSFLLHVKYTLSYRMLSVTPIMPGLVLMSMVGVGMQRCVIWNQNEMHILSKVKNGRKHAANNKQ